MVWVSEWLIVFHIAMRQAICNELTVIVCDRKMLPLRPSAGKSIHRSQGSTYVNAAVDFSEQTSAVEHIAYVAISRVKSLNGLKMAGFKASHIKVCQQVAAEMKRLR